MKYIEGRKQANKINLLDETTNIVQISGTDMKSIDVVRGIRTLTAGLLAQTDIPNQGGRLCQPNRATAILLQLQLNK